MDHRLIFGCAADDFTGASDAASFLVKGGLDTMLYNEIPDNDANSGSGAAVIALKTRTQETESAIEDTERAVNWLKAQGAQQIFIKYCSTFDSTAAGNIGPICDRILEDIGEKYTILSPALPVNGRTVSDGKLYVYGIPLSESHMKDHPLTPMWSSDIAELMKPQSRYECLTLTKETMNRPDSEIRSLLEEFGRNKEHFYIIPDYMDDADAQRIMELFGELPVLTGSSGLMEKIGSRYARQINGSSEDEGRKNPAPSDKALLLAGSCSKATLDQIACFKKHGEKSVRLDPEALLDGTQTVNELWKAVENAGTDEVLVYSSDTAENVKENQKSGREKITAMLEGTTAELAKKAAACGYTRIIVAGGETSGAVTKALGFNSYIIGSSVAPGVPVMIPAERRDIRLVLKSGNFGQEDFFFWALEMTKGE